ncbi:MAG TPA: hypothetical protein VLQ89_07865, partial [Candidatus Binatia bacterium]|nr:hypothetical protein [Candidatus Binatia bacterium]
MKRKHLGQLFLIGWILFSNTACRCGCSDGIVASEPALSALNLEEITVRRLQQGYSEKRFSVLQVVQGYLQRIEAIDRNGPKLNAVLRVNPDALAIAAALDAELNAGQNRGPL